MEPIRLGSGLSADGRYVTIGGHHMQHNQHSIVVYEYNEKQNYYLYKMQYNHSSMPGDSGLASPGVVARCSAAQRPAVVLARRRHLHRLRAQVRPAHAGRSTAKVTSCSFTSSRNIARYYIFTMNSTTQYYNETHMSDTFVSGQLENNTADFTSGAVNERTDNGGQFYDSTGVTAGTTHTVTLPIESRGPSPPTTAPRTTTTCPTCAPRSTWRS